MGCAFTLGATPAMSPDAPSRTSTDRSTPAVPLPCSVKPSCIRVLMTSVGCVTSVAAIAAIVPDAKFTATLGRPSWNTWDGPVATTTTEACTKGDCEPDELLSHRQVEV